MIALNFTPGCPLGVAEELLWFISGKTDARLLRDKVGQKCANGQLIAALMLGLLWC